MAKKITPDITGPGPAAARPTIAKAPVAQQDALAAAKAERAAIEAERTQDEAIAKAGAIQLGPDPADAGADDDGDTLLDIPSLSGRGAPSFDTSVVPDDPGADAGPKYGSGMISAGGSTVTGHAGAYAVIGNSDSEVRKSFTPFDQGVRVENPALMYGGLTNELPDDKPAEAPAEEKEDTTNENVMHEQQNDDGSTTTVYNDGTIVTAHPDGTTEVSHPDGTTETTYPDGTHVEEYPDGSSSTVHPDGSVTETPPPEDTDDTDDTDDAKGSAGIPDEEQVDLPPELQAQLEADLAELRALRGPGTGDGVTDPADDGGIGWNTGVAGPLPTDQKFDLVGQPVEAGGPLDSGREIGGAPSFGDGHTDPAPDADTTPQTSGPEERDTSHEIEGGLDALHDDGTDDGGDEGTGGDASFLPISTVLEPVHHPLHDLSLDLDD